MNKTIRVYTSDQMLKVGKSTMITGLRYQIGYKTVGDAPFFNRDDVRVFLLECLDKQIMANNILLSNVQISDSSVSFIIDAPLNFNLKSFVQFTAQSLINKTHAEFPELELKATAPSGVLSRLWHRPYYVKTLSVDEFHTIEEYMR